MAAKQGTPQLVDEMLRQVEDNAKQMDTNYAFSGGAGSSGSHLRELATYYNYGRQGQIPPEWEPLIDTLDPDWITYQALHAKFRGRTP